MTTVHDTSRSPISGADTLNLLRQEGSSVHLPKQTIEAERDIGFVSEHPDATEVSQRSAIHESQPPSPAQGDTRASLGGLKTPTAPSSEGSWHREKEATESAATGTEGMKTVEGEVPAPHTLPARAVAVQKAVAEVFAAENERRAAALASRISSRTISRAEGSAELKRFEQRSDVAEAAAEQLRRMEAARAATSEPLVVRRKHFTIFRLKG